MSSKDLIDVSYPFSILIQQPSHRRRKEAVSTRSPIWTGNVFHLVTSCFPIEVSKQMIDPVLCNWSYLLSLKHHYFL